MTAPDRGETCALRLLAEVLRALELELALPQESETFFVYSDGF
jgi:hypothetical protein